MRISLFMKKFVDAIQIDDDENISDEEIDKLGHIDHSGDDDEIKEVNDETLNQKVKEFEEKYGG